MPRGKKKTTRKKSNLRVVKGGKGNGRRKSTKRGKKAKSKKFDASTFYKKYPHVVKDSIKEVTPGSTVGGIKAVHGRICKIKCKKDGKTRTINVQDAFQVKFCTTCQTKAARERAAQRRKTKGKKRTRKAS